MTVTACSPDISNVCAYFCDAGTGDIRIHHAYRAWGDGWAGTRTTFFCPSPSLVHTLLLSYPIPALTDAQVLVEYVSMSMGTGLTY